MAKVYDLLDKTPLCPLCGRDLEPGKIGPPLYDDANGGRVGILCRECYEAGTRQAAAKARTRAAQQRSLATQVDDPGLELHGSHVPESIRQYADYLDHLAGQVETWVEWPKE